MNNNPLNNSHESDSDAFEQMFHRSLQQHGFIFPENEEDIEALRQRALASNTPVPNDLPSAATILAQGRIDSIKGWHFAPQPEDELTSTWQNLLVKLKSAGLSEKFVMQRLVPRWAANVLNHFDSKHEHYQVAIEQLLVRLTRIFNVQVEDILGSKPLPIPVYQSTNTRYKKPANTEITGIAAYTLYAKALAEILLKASSYLPAKAIPTDYREFQSQVIAMSGSLTFENTLRYVWSLGIPVLPLNDSANFHGACFRINSRNVIILKQNTMSAIRWLFDLLHEVKHASDYLEETSRDVVETSALFSADMSLSAEEESANKFASDVVLNGKGDQLALRVVNAAGKAGNLLKSKVIEVARQENVDAGALANHLAYLLMTQQRFNWWGVATNLQSTEQNPKLIAKAVLYNYVNLSSLSSDELDLLTNAIE